MKSYLFTYGTLQPNANLDFFEENNLDQYLKVVGRGTVSGELLHIRNNEQNIDYPGLINAGQSTETVHGTVFEVSNVAVFTLLNKHEGYTPGFSVEESRRKNYYELAQVVVSLDGDGTDLPVTTYILNRESDYFKSDFIEEKGFIPSGDWLEYVKQLIVE